MPTTRLTKLEMQIMEALWTRGACSVREIQETFPEPGRPAYTTVQTTVYRLERKKAARISKRISNANIFEAVKSTSGGEEGTPEQPPIQKLMSAPVLNADREVLGVIQISRKGFDLKSAGPDFTLDDLQQLETAAKNLSQLPFLKEE